MFPRFIIHKNGHNKFACLLLTAVSWLGIVSSAWGLHPQSTAMPPSIVITQTETAEGDPGPRDYVLFESGPVRPLAMSTDGQRLYAANTPDGKLEIFAVTDVGLVHLYSVPVGMEPVAVAVASNGDVWVVNHLSDSVSIVDTQAITPHVKTTLLVGDEPRDIVFGGAGNNRAFITTAHRGQHNPSDPQSTIPGVGRADVWVFESDASGALNDRQPLTILSLLGDTPRALAVSPDGETVYAAVFHSGNRTTTLPPANFSKLPPLTSFDGINQPDTGLIVQFNDFFWADEAGNDLSARVGFSLPDHDVFAIDASADPPRSLRSYNTIGTTLFNMAVNPVNGDIYVSNTEARNMVRFSGVASRASTSVRGHIADNRITVISGDEIMPRHLNKHLDFSRLFGTPEEREASLSIPLQMVVSADGETLYVAAYGSGKVGVFNTDELAADSFRPNAQTHIEVGGGPAGMVLDESRQQLYVLTRFDNAVNVVDLQQGAEIQQLKLFNPEPEHIVVGRPFMYDARLTSSRGNDSCATCHVFGNLDALAWDLGDPDGVVQPIPNVYHPMTAGHPGLNFTFHPMKGPMTTQSMRGLKRHGPMHWRGDRTGSQREPDESLEAAAFKEFNEAFEGFMARENQLTEAQMQVFTDFTLELTYPPNPHRRLDNTLNADQAIGRQMFSQGFARPNQGVELCAQCHTLDPARGLFGTSGLMSFNNQPGEKDFKIPHFRDQYQKVGMFTPSLVNPFISGPQIRGFGYNHNGATSSSAILAEFFLPTDLFRQTREFFIAFPTESPPILGEQTSISADNADSVSARLDLMITQARVTSPLPECDLVVQSPDAQQSWLYDRQSDRFMPDSSDGMALNEMAMRSLLTQADVLYLMTCVPWGSGQRIALDRDGDGLFNADERKQGSNPADQQSTTFRPRSGIWWNPARSGHGIDVQRSGNLLGVTWFTYLEDGRSVWYRAVAPLKSDWTAPLQMFRWDAQQQSAQASEVGSLNLVFTSATEVTMNWEIGNNSGSEAFIPFTFSRGQPAPDFTGLWFTPEFPGFGLSIDSQGNRRYLVATVYNGLGEPVWAIGSAANTLDGTLPLDRWRGPCPYCEFFQITSERAGEATFRFDGLRTGRLDINVTSADSGVWVREDTLLRPLSQSRN